MTDTYFSPEGVIASLDQLTTEDLREVVLEALARITLIEHVSLLDLVDDLRADLVEMMSEQKQNGHMN